MKNLYADQSILLFKECYASEKIHGCLNKGTLIRTANGANIPIEQITVGTEILSYDEKLKQFVPATVSAVVIQERDIRLGWMRIVVEDGSAIVCTEDHPFLTARGWVIASQLTAEDDILTV